MVAFPFTRMRDWASKSTNSIPISPTSRIVGFVDPVFDEARIDAIGETARAKRVLEASCTEPVTFLGHGLEELRHAPVRMSAEEKVSSLPGPSGCL